MECSFGGGDDELALPGTEPQTWMGSGSWLEFDFFSSLCLLLIFFFFFSFSVKIVSLSALSWLVEVKEASMHPTEMGAFKPDKFGRIFCHMQIDKSITNEM
eukprot:TRINITY_DN4386_c0_g1_i1.p1 TRINITY_DN4386_c0_g1~~TRINITY_DN4386_c0_g1_i1.p1  ORF type:complete len:101 (+),score=15.41 TRINITY_DN4386_c0_g1_i1:115-417(+)